METGKEGPTREMVQDLGRVVSHPEYQQILERLESLPDEEREDYARKVASIEEFRQRGIPVPEGLRVSVRYFEDPLEPSPKFNLLDSEIEDPSTAPTICVSVGAGAFVTICVSVGN